MLGFFLLLGFFAKVDINNDKLIYTPFKVSIPPI